MLSTRKICKLEGQQIEGSTVRVVVLRNPILQELSFAFAWRINTLADSGDFWTFIKMPAENQPQQPPSESSLSYLLNSLVLTFVLSLASTSTTAALIAAPAPAGQAGQTGQGPAGQAGQGHARK